MNRVAGSRAYTAAVRAVMFAVDDPDSPDAAQPDRLLFARGNLAPSSTGRRYAIEGRPIVLDDGNERDHPAIVWKGESVVRIEDAFSRTDRAEDADARTATDEAVELLEALLADGPMNAEDVMKRASAERVTEKPLRRGGCPSRRAQAPARVRSGVARRVVAAP